MSILTKDNAKEATIELYSKKNGIDYTDAEAKVKKSQFNKIWDEHDNMNKGFIFLTFKREIEFGKIEFFHNAKLHIIFKDAGI